MTTVFLDAVFKPFFFKSSMSRANKRRSIGRISWRMDSFKSFNVRVCECKHAISNTPEKKITRWKIGSARRPRHVSETVNEVPGKHVSNNGHWLVCRVRCGTILLKPHTGTVYSSSAPFWVLSIQKMSGSRGSSCTCFECLHQPSSGRHKITRRIKREEASPNKQWCTTVLKSHNYYSEDGITTLKLH